MTLWKWSRTPSTNATADSTCPFPEGMAPSAVNDGVRGLMAAAAKYRDDMSGALLTTGTSTAYLILVEWIELAGTQHPRCNKDDIYASGLAAENKSLRLSLGRDGFKLNRNCAL